MLRIRIRSRISFFKTGYAESDLVKVESDPQNCLKGGWFYLQGRIVLLTGPGRKVLLAGEESFTYMGGKFYLQGRKVLLAGENSFTCRGGKFYLQGRKVLLTGEESFGCRGGKFYLQGRIVLLVEEESFTCRGE